MAKLLGNARMVRYLMQHRPEFLSTRVLSGEKATVSMTDVDRQYLMSVAAERAGISPEEAEQRIDEIVAQAAEFEEQARIRPGARQ